ncbi:hypothetical protein W97_05629 [Coniosporium apollinis CBS 100218]|uniref:Major facilitator superfamily (MFS) profile domain-containing protein n=1 Tax=Coniosporium apollinis (strain CBS 100218) TaxID=1168221 RepID=R7YX52_CONA1|nr:uncharacterized protein W97_05629 [Coniosporium apollinis CBS 100218]EON66236.1 hypothetical protein W97_05629 [Coniosporium apollinis CBS 100218]
MLKWKPWRAQARDNTFSSSKGDLEKRAPERKKWSMGILSDEETDKIPGSVLLYPEESDHNGPLSLHNTPAEILDSSLTSSYPSSVQSGSAQPTRTEKKRTAGGKIILEPQPDESQNDPLNWPKKRRNAALLSIGFYCMAGGGMAPLLATGFHDIAETYHVSEASVALTTRLYILGLGIGSLVCSPTAILFGKRPVYLATTILFILSSVWCALSPNYPSLLVARIVQGLAVSPVECLPSASVAEISFLHKRPYRLGIYTLFLLGGMNLVPLISAVVIQALGWSWVFWIVAMVVGLCFVLLFLFVPETFWDRTPRPYGYNQGQREAQPSEQGSSRHPRSDTRDASAQIDGGSESGNASNFPLLLQSAPGTLAHRRRERHPHSGNADNNAAAEKTAEAINGAVLEFGKPYSGPMSTQQSKATSIAGIASPGSLHSDAWRVVPMGGAPKTPLLRNLNSPFYESQANEDDYFALSATAAPNVNEGAVLSQPQESPTASEPLRLVLRLPSPPLRSALRSPHQSPEHSSPRKHSPPHRLYTTCCYRLHRILEDPPAENLLQTLRPYYGRLSQGSWLKVAVRPFVLFAYPSILWSTVVYSLSIGWLIVLSESVCSIYRDRDSYNFSALQTGLVYLSPFIGGILGTIVAGKVSDHVVWWMAKHNGGVYEPEFRLAMAAPVAVCTMVGLMGFGWIAEEREAWIVPTVFFGAVSFGCTLGCMTAITFAVDCYSGLVVEAMVTLNLGKNVFHGLVFSLFFTHWLESDGPRVVFLAIGGIQMACLLVTTPMYVYGKRARMWTARKNLMEKF